ncbi:MAG: hypothetical protein Q7R41_16665, partial [Phycisphaerales bacterium]|nr:hypothetical protein [Phycisphaerales bacterium]
MKTAAVGSELFSALFLFVLCGSGSLHAQVRFEWTVGGEKREAIVYAPSKSSDARRPAVFVWHGRGGEMRAAADKFRIHRLWPEAVVVYPQGLPTPGKLTDREGRHSGWQFSAGEQGDRDLKFFDVLLASVRKDHGADGPIYA